MSKISFLGGIFTIANKLLTINKDRLEIYYKQLVYEITEYNMVPDKKSTINIQTPRKQKLSLKFGSSLIDSNHFAIFASWIDKKDNLYYNFENIPYNFNLLYRASRDGMDTKQFRNNCNNKGATIVITQVKGTNQIIDKKDINTAIIGRVKNTNSAIFCAGTLGPAFGPGADLYCTSGKQWKCSSQNHYYSINLPFRTFFAEDYEVFQVIKKQSIG
ncbi:hypothetical protein GLOIN_2v1725214 [Rhizophagus irregularis DAOM 181602=DAOM 197198]|nr:hypothetical protein GLOIN_2v1725214 [Rhizophagus irregularis DAOM 181602=DAOM 197198]